MAMNSLSHDRKARKDSPIFSGCLIYFPNALAAVAALSKHANDFHNPGEPLHWARDKSTDHADCIVRHLIDSGSFDSDGIRHSVKVAWRALALAQEEIEHDEHAPMSRGSRTVMDELTALSQSLGLYDMHPMMAEVLRESDGKEHAP